MNAQNNLTSNQDLNPQQKSIVSIAALTAVGDLEHLKTQLNSGLDAGLTISEIKEVLVQLSAYCGFPRSLNSINTFMIVVEERKAKGMSDVKGKDASPITDTANKYETGKKTLQTLTGQEEKGPKTGANAFAPVIDTFLKEHLFADIFSRDILTHQQRELATISVLSAMEGGCITTSISPGCRDEYRTYRKPVESSLFDYRNTYWKAPVRNSKKCFVENG